MDDLAGSSISIRNKDDEYEHAGQPSSHNNRREKIDEYFTSAPEVLLQSRLSQSYTSKFRYCSKMVENDRFEKDFLYKLIFHPTCTDWHEKWYRRAGRHLLRLTRAIPENREASMVPMVVRTLTGVNSVGDMTDLNEEHKYPEQHEHLQMELNLYNAFNALYSFIVDNETGALRGNTSERVSIRLETARVIMLLLCVHYDLSFVNWITNPRINPNAPTFFSLDSFMSLIQNSLPRRVASIVDGEYKDISEFPQDVIRDYISNTPIDPYRFCPFSMKPPGIISDPFEIRMCMTNLINLSYVTDCMVGNDR